MNKLQDKLYQEYLESIRHDNNCTCGECKEDRQSAHDDTKYHTWRDDRDSKQSN